MNSDALGAIATHVNSLQTGVGIPNAGYSFSQGDFWQGVTGLGSALEGLASLAGRGSPILATGLGLADIGLSLTDIAHDATTTGFVQKSDVTSLAAGVAGTLGGITLAVTSAAVTTAVLPVVLGAALVVTAAALTVQAQMQAGEEPWETPEIKQMNDAAKKFMDDFGDVAKQITDALLDPAFWEAFAEQGAKLFDPLLDPLNEAGHWIGQNLPTPQEIRDAVKNAWDRAKDFVLRRDPLTFDLDGDGLETVGASSTNPILFDHDGDGTKNGTGWIASDDAMLVLDRNGNGTIDNGRELFGDSTLKSNGQTATDGFDALADIDSNADGVVNNQDAQFTNLKLWRDLNQDGTSQTGELFTLNALGIASINITNTANSQTLANGNQLTNTGIYTKADGTTGSVADINLANDTFHRQFGNVLNTTTVANLPDMQGSGAVRDLREAANDGDWRRIA